MPFLSMQQQGDGDALPEKGPRAGFQVPVVGGRFWILMELWNLRLVTCEDVSCRCAGFPVFVQPV